MLRIISSIVLAIALAAECAPAPTPEPPGGDPIAMPECVEGTWNTPDNSMFDPVNGSFPIRAESEHFQIRFPADKPGLISASELTTGLEEMEKVWDWAIGTAKFIEPFCRETTKFKVTIFTDDGYGLSGSGNGINPAMWVGPGAIRDLSQGRNGGMVHEFTHTLQFASNGFRRTEFGGWFWESHAEFMANSYPGNPATVGCSEMLASMPHLYYGSTRDRYCNWQLWDFIRMEYGWEGVQALWTTSAGQTGQDPVATIKQVLNIDQAQLGDLFGRFARANVNWDYDGEAGQHYRSVYGPNTEVAGVTGNKAKNLRLARMEAIDAGQRQYVVSQYWAPQQYGYNLVRLIPEPGRTELVVDFRGVVQQSINPGAETGWGDYQPGFGRWASFPQNTDPASDWRWAVVALTADGGARYSDLQAGARGSLSFPMQPGDVDYYLAVAATPSEHYSIFWDQKYHTLYRYPYKIQVRGGWAEGHEPGYDNVERYGFGRLPGRRHPNGGGWVHNAAIVDPSVYVGPNAMVYGGEVRGNARIEDYAVIWDGSVRDNAVVGGLTQLFRGFTVEGDAELRMVMADYGALSGPPSVFGGTAKIYGDAEAQLGGARVDRGAFSGYLVADFLNSSQAHGFDRSSIPVEVTAPIPGGWPG